MNERWRITLTLSIILTPLQELLTHLSGLPIFYDPDSGAIRSLRPRQTLSQVLYPDRKDKIFIPPTSRAPD